MMKYLLQFVWILAFSLVGFLLHAIIPLPIPASIYGLILMFIALSTRLLKIEQVKETSHFLVEIMAAMFVCPTVGIMKAWNLIREDIFSILLIVVVSFFITFVVSGLVTKWLMKGREKHD